MLPSAWCRLKVIRYSLQIHPDDASCVLNSILAVDKTQHDASVSSLFGWLVADG
jgi:hypothetical protein